MMGFLTFSRSLCREVETNAEARRLRRVAERVHIG